MLLGIDERDGVYFDCDNHGRQRYTAITEEGEEIDIDARDQKHARAIAKLAIERDYEPMKIRIIVGPRTGLYL